jgi:hypothetical protein
MYWSLLRVLVVAWMILHICSVLFNTFVDHTLAFWSLIIT